MLLRVCNLLLALFCALPPATFAFLFVNPASHGGQTSFSQNPVYAEKSILEVQWTSAAEDQDATVALFQVDISRTRATDVSPWTIGDLEYIAGEFHSMLCYSSVPYMCNTMIYTDV